MGPTNPQLPTQISDPGSPHSPPGFFNPHHPSTQSTTIPTNHSLSAPIQRHQYPHHGSHRPEYTYPPFVFPTNLPPFTIPTPIPPSGIPIDSDSSSQTNPSMHLHSTITDLRNLVRDVNLPTIFATLDWKTNIYFKRYQNFNNIHHCPLLLISYPFTSLHLLHSLPFPPFLNRPLHFQPTHIMFLLLLHLRPHHPFLSIFTLLPPQSHLFRIYIPPTHPTKTPVLILHYVLCRTMMLLCKHFSLPTNTIVSTRKTTRRNDTYPIKEATF